MSILESARKDLAMITARASEIQLDIDKLQKTLEAVGASQYAATQKLVHIEEIFRVARIQFNRLRLTTGELSSADVQEIEKWIKRAKNQDGLQNILNALNSLKKFRPRDIKRNLYALIQKIIIEGPKP